MSSDYWLDIFGLENCPVICSGLTIELFLLFWCTKNKYDDHTINYICSNNWTTKYERSDNLYYDGFKSSTLGNVKHWATKKKVH